MQAFHANKFVQAHLGMLLWALIVGLSFPAVGLMGKGLPSLLITAMRFVLAVLVVMPLALRKDAPEARTCSSKRRQVSPIPTLAPPRQTTMASTPRKSFQIPNPALIASIAPTLPLVPG